jgi:hypothetical protein
MSEHLDGNAVAGPLSQVFAVDVTTAVGTCGHCGARAPLATVRVYVSGPGTTLRCAVCESVVMRFARIRGRLVLDASGCRSLEAP